LLAVPGDLRGPSTLREADAGPGAGQAPSVARQEGCFALFDGLLYNRQEIAARLRLPYGGPADLVLGAYATSREHFLADFAGLYALVVHDERREVLVAARDRVGSYPLFYADAGGELLLSTSIELILNHERVSRELNRLALADHLAHRWPDPGETYYSAVRRVPPGHALVIRGGVQRVSRYWRPVAEDEPVPWVRPEQLEQFEDLLDQAVMRFLSLGRSSVFLSGGLDSVTVAAVATTLSRDRRQAEPLALSLGFSAPGENEQAVQRRVAADLGLDQVLVPLEEASGPGGLVASALELSSRWPVPLVNSLWLPAYLHLAREGRQRGCDVIFTGQGGDEWLTVTPFYAADLIFALDIRGLFRLWDNHRRSYPIPPLTVLKSLLWQFGTRPLLGLTAERIAPQWKQARRRRRLVDGGPEWIAPDPELRRMLEQRAESSTEERRRPGKIYLSEMDRALDHALVAMELEELFECGKRLGLRFACPFWDADLLAFLYRTPPELLNQGGRSKGLVRAALARRFPDLGFEVHRKITGNTTARTMYVREGRNAWQRLGGATTLTELGIVDGEAVRRMVDDLLARPVSPEKNVHSYRIWDTLTLEAWARTHA
jgi:asparagine synthase (glutamine-hydrolysing)